MLFHLQIVWRLKWNQLAELSVVGCLADKRQVLSVDNLASAWQYDEHYESLGFLDRAQIPL